jgi:lipopolysaccharide transport system ATP-binding protein
MSADVLVRVEGLSKKFCRDLKRSLWFGLKDAAADLVGRNSVRSLRPDEFWALDGISFELRRGECLGLIGRNGAGKTTLLKMLNGLIKPDKGRIEIRGRMGALISLGAGFNPILTGRENIYVNGSVLGLTRKDIDARLDEIVDFAEIGDFINTPVQSYSSGMQVRLGFAVATALQPDVLLLDEILAVGDAAFRAKCYDRLASIREDAAFVLVSHDTDQIARVCSQVLVLDRGSENYLGDVGEGIRRYQELSRPHTRFVSHEHVAEGFIAALASCDATVGPDGLFNFSVSMHVTQPVSVADVRVVFSDEDGLPAFDSYTRTQGQSIRLVDGRQIINCAVGPLWLQAGRYAMSVALLDRENNRHLYWGDKIRVVEVQGPTAAAAAYTPLLRCRAVTATSGDSDLHERSTPKAHFHA